mgnify:CR=1 FL=1
MNTAVLKHNSGNIYSVINGLKRIGVEPTLSGDPEIIRAADKVIFPGVGEASTTMAYLRETKLAQVMRDLKQPTLGICIGLQLMCKSSEEGNTQCLGIFDEEVKKFVPTLHEQKVPHMGWNTLEEMNSPLFKNLPQNPFVYYVHSFCASIGQNTIAQTNYIQPYSAALHKNNFYAVQFHPEKSGHIGEIILKNFIEL